MVYIFKDRLIRVEWTIYKGISPVKEDFSRSNVKVFLLGNREKYLLHARANKGTLYVDIPSGLEEGTYSIEAIWVKNMDHVFDTRSICRSKKEDLFSITEFEDEATNIGEGVVVLKVKTSTATYGYDGLSSYELAVLRGDWNGTEGEWLKHERYVSVLDSRGDSKVDTMSQDAITKELEKQDEAIEGIRDETNDLGDRVEEAEDKVKDMGDAVDEIKSHAPVSARPAGFKPDVDLTPEITVDRAWRDHEGNVIRDTYITRRGLKNEIIDITNQQVTDLKPGSVDPDDLSEATKQLIGNKSITNLPDEEDITVTDSQTLKLKDKEYAPKDYSGMGRVYLRKHYVNGVNTLTQHMMRKPNTIYIIQYDYCLTGQTIEVPENCVLDFQGGSLRNGEILLKATLLLGEPKFYCSLSGIVSNNFIDYSWYANNNLSSFKEFLKLRNNNKSNIIYNITKNVDLNGETLIVPLNTTLNFQGGSINNGEINFGEEGLSYIKGNVDTKNVTMYGNYQPYYRSQRDVTIDDFGRQSLADLFLTYNKHKDEFIYGGRNAAFNPNFNINKPFEINCSTFSLLMASGIPYENSAYCGGHNTTNGTGYWGYKDLIDWYKAPNPNRNGDEALKYSHQLAQYLNNLGYTIGTPDVGELETGDILFYSLSDNNTGVHPYLSIDHSAIFAYRQNDNKFCVWEVQNGGPVAAFYLNSYYCKNIKLVARLPRVGGRGLLQNNIGFNPYDTITSTSGSLLRSLNTHVSMKAYEYYTAILKIEFEDDDTAYPRITRNGKVLATYDNYKSRPKDGYYVLPFYFHEDILSVNIEIVTRKDGKSVKLTEAFLFKGFIDQYNSSFIRPVFYNNSFKYNRVEDENIKENGQIIKKIPNGYRLTGNVVVDDDSSLKEDSLLLATIEGIKINSYKYIGNVVNSYNKPGIVFLNTENEFRLVNTNGGKYQFYDILLITEDLAYG